MRETRDETMAVAAWSREMTGKLRQLLFDLSYIFDKRGPVKLGKLQSPLLGNLFSVIYLNI